jgi:hypothetical protein
MTNLNSFAKPSRARGGVLSLYFLIVPFSLAVALAPALWGGKTLLPADQLNTMMLPYSAKFDSVEVYNHFLTDAIAQVYPYKVRWRANALRGEFASWNPMIFGGHPHYASTSFTHFDPTNLVLLLGEMPTAYHWQMALKLLIAGVGMWVLLSFFRVEGAALHGAVRAMFASAYMLNSLFITTLQHQWLVGTFAWTPFTAYFLLRALERLLEISPGRGFFSATLDGALLRRGAFAAFFLALACFSGSLQTNAIGILALITLTFGVAWSSDGGSDGGGESPARRFSRSALVLAAVGALAFALSAAMWLPSLELFAYNENARAEGKIFSVWNSLKSLPLLVSFIIPELIGSPRGFDLAKIAQADMNDFNAFLGFAPFAFACIGVFVLWNNPAVEARWTRPFILLAALGLLIPLVTPLYKFIYHRGFILYVFGMTVVGAQAAHYIVFSSSWRGVSLRQTSARRVFRALALFLVLVVCGLVFVNIVLELRYEVVYAQIKAFVERNMSVAQLAGGSARWMLRRIDVFLHHYSWRNPQMWLAIGIPALALALGHFLAFGAVFSSISLPVSGANERWRLWTLWALSGLTIVQLWAAAYSWLPMVDMERFPLYPPTQTTDFLRKDSSLHRFLPLFDAASHRVMQPNINDMYGIACVQGYESIFACTAAQIAGTLSQPPSAQELRLSGLANVKYFVASAKNPYSHEFLRLVDSGATLIYENLLAEPRAYMRYRSRTVRANKAHKCVVVPDRETYARIFIEDTSFAAREVLLHEDSPIDAATTLRSLEDSAPTPRHAVRFLAYENNRVKLEVETEREGWCVLADSYYPGWKAHVNGMEARIYRANYAVRAVAVPAGKSAIEFRFEPDTFRVGVWISGAGGAALCLLTLIGGRLRREGRKLRSLNSSAEER